MRARAAYISSFGTTGILVSSALLMLAMVSALVAFHGWPGSTADHGVASVPLAPPARQAAQVKQVRKSPAAAPAKKTARAHRAAASHAATTVGLVKAPSGGDADGGAGTGSLVKVVDPPAMVPTGSSVTVTSPQVPAGPGHPGGGPTPAPAPGRPLPNPSPATGQVQQAVDQLFGTVPPPPGSQQGAGVTLPTLEPGAPVQVGVRLGDASITIGLR
jgi:hypothetical protein